MREFLDRYFKPLYIAIVALSLLSLSAVGAIGYLYWKPRPAPQPILAKIGTLIELPTGEEPTITTITDKTKLAGQAFFAPAENGDIVLIYPNAQKVYLYRPGTHKIIDLAPVNLPSPTPPSLPTPIP